MMCSDSKVIIYVITKAISSKDVLTDFQDTSCIATDLKFSLCTILTACDVPDEQQSLWGKNVKIYCNFISFCHWFWQLKVVPDVFIEKH